MLAGTGASLPKELRGASATVTRAPAADGKVTVQISGGATFVVASSDIRCVRALAVPALQSHVVT